MDDELYLNTDDSRFVEIPQAAALTIPIAYGKLNEEKRKIILQSLIFI